MNVNLTFESIFEDLHIFLWFLIFRQIFWGQHWRRVILNIYSWCLMIFTELIQEMFYSNTSKTILSCNNKKDHTGIFIWERIIWQDDMYNGIVINSTPKSVLNLNISDICSY